MRLNNNCEEEFVFPGLPVLLDVVQQFQAREAPILFILIRCMRLAMLPEKKLARLEN